MKKALLAFIFLIVSQHLMAQDVVGPEGHKLWWILAGVLLLLLIAGVTIGLRNRSLAVANPFTGKKRIAVELSKDRKYYPDYVKLIVTNTGRADLDLAGPLLVFDNFWLKRKFRLTGMNNYRFYPLLLGAGKTHELNIDINRFYRHDNRLKRFPKIRIVINETTGKRLGSRSVFLRKTLFKF